MSGQYTVDMNPPLGLSFDTYLIALSFASLYFSSKYSLSFDFHTLFEVDFVADAEAPDADGGVLPVSAVPEPEYIINKLNATVAN